MEDKSAAVETFTREKATSDPGSVGAPMSGVVVEIRVKEGHEVKRGDIISILSAMKVRSHELCRWRRQRLIAAFRWRALCQLPCQVTSNEFLFTKVCCFICHLSSQIGSDGNGIGDSLNQGDLLVEIVQ